MKTDQIFEMFKFLKYSQQKNLEGHTVFHSQYWDIQHFLLT